MMDRLNSLAFFVAVAERGGITAAARKLGRSPSAVSRAVAALFIEKAAALLRGRFDAAEPG